MGWIVRDTLRSLYHHERGTIPIVQEVGCGPGPVWTFWRRWNLAPTGFRTLDRSALACWVCTLCHLITSWLHRPSWGFKNSAATYWYFRD